MAIPTSYFNLLKPDVGESYNVQTLNDNYDKIDTQMHLNNVTQGKVPFMWAQKGATFGNPWDGPNDTTVRSPDMGSHTWSWRIGLTDNDITIEDQDVNTKDNTYRIKKAGLWFVGFKMQGASLANAQRITLGVTPLLVQPPSGSNDQWSAESGFNYAQIYDDGSGSVPIAVSYGHMLFKQAPGDTLYRPGFFAKRSGTTAISAFNGTIGFTYLGAFETS